MGPSPEFRRVVETGSSRAVRRRLETIVAELAADTTIYDAASIALAEQPPAPSITTD